MNQIPLAIPTAMESSPISGEEDDFSFEGDENSWQIRDMNCQEVVERIISTLHNQTEEDYRTVFSHIALCILRYLEEEDFSDIPGSVAFTEFVLCPILEVCEEYVEVNFFLANILQRIVHSIATNHFGALNRERLMQRLL
ncbi:hypothetical protein A3A21_01075 [Candidatus Jorgensenbacteria bacterium RIFCSPLOWO2_01_FULL_45_25b]|uniref:Uncharacterized protein n=1 Tax=Candidatus Jorgensenbacteria bacterium RIFCSPLOWO2_01_FULL_45_25b TaxID=1798471 RepID=A0A1F6BWC0_9BACT|nr:MAG: hypothetical protein A3A21_01075 [Candidatus Jorgensenbacteria bacterium RIFCSPLOWO2_01_FULL_45_25b]